MSSQDNDQDNRVVAVVLISAILLAVGLALGMGISKARSGGSASASGEMAVAAADAPAADGSAGAMAEGSTGMAGEAAPATASEAASGAATAAAAGNGDDASVVIENGVVKFYFASAKADLAPGALVALGDAIAAAKAGKRLVLSGFHDASGNAAMNAELAKRRAMSVRDALVGAGVAESSLELKKPEESTGSGNDAEARRVEVTIVE